MVCQQCGFFHVSSDCLPARMFNATLWTAEWYVNSVDFFMGLQISCLRKCLATLWTTEWFVTSVDLFMGLQIAFLRNRVSVIFDVMSPTHGQLSSIDPRLICQD